MLALALTLVASLAQEAAGEHHGGCILRTPLGEVPAALYQESEVVETDEYRPFTKKLTVCGIVLIAEDEVPDPFLRRVGRTIKEIFSRNGDVDRELQKELIERLYAHKAIIPVPRTERSLERLIEGNEAALDRIQAQASMCDIIMAEVPEGQVMEVVEHILHIVTDVGLHTRFPAEWGISEDSELSEAMWQAVEKGYYSIDSYRDLEEEVDPDTYNRILLQEFAYWFISTAWDLQEPYGPKEPEWTIRDREELAEKLPEFFEVYERTVERVMTAPSLSTLAEFGPTRREERSR